MILKRISFSQSSSNVLRGLHYQESTFTPIKIVYCSFGHIFDVVVDIDPTSNTFAQAYTFDLCPETSSVIVMCGLFAHGFLSMSSHSITSYLTNYEYA